MKNPPKKPRPDRRTEAQILLEVHLGELGVRNVVREFYFCPDRKWHCDLFLPTQHILIELDGGVCESGYRDKHGVFHQSGAGHKRGAALADDYMKQNVAQMMGYRIMRFTNEQALTGQAKEFLKGWL